MTIRVGIDGRAMGGDVRDGLSNVSCNYFLHFPETQDVEFVVFSPHQNLFPEIANCRPYELVGASGFRKGWFYTKLPFLLQRHPVDVFWSPLQTLPFGIPEHTKAVVTIHDFTYLKYPETMSALRRWNLKFLAVRTVKRADLLVAISKTTAKDLAVLYGGSEKTVVIYNGVDHGVFYPEEEFSSVLRGKGLESGKYFLVVGSLEPRKNLQTLLDASVLFLKEIPMMDRPKFVFVYGNSWKAHEWEHRIEEGILTHRDSVPLKGISTELLRNLYSHALALVFPSLYEGFGLPVLEAMSCGCPVIASDTHVFREIGERAVVFFNKESASELKKALQELWIKETHNHILTSQYVNITQKYNWTLSACELFYHFIRLSENKR
ncbi:MAG: glycosyltransferase family 4 protein [Synergistales bacterium]